jgi:hypothetical protein
MHPATPARTRSTHSRAETSLDRRRLALYLRNHDAGAHAGAGRFAEAARQHRDATTRAALTRLRYEVEQDQDALASVMQALGVPPSRLQRALGVLGERAGRLKPNGALLRRPPITDVIELEALVLGVSGKLRLWHALDELSPVLPELDHIDLYSLAARARDQLGRLDVLHRETVRALDR